MKTARLVVALLFVVEVAAGGAPKRAASKAVDLPVCKATMAFGTPCVWFGLEGLKPAPTPAPAATPLPSPDDFPTEFFVSTSEVAAAWGRAQAAAAKYATMRIQTATDFVIETYRPREFYDFAVRIIKTPVENGFEISVEGTNQSAERIALMGSNYRYITDKDRESARLAERTTRAIAYYIASGKKP